MSICHRPATSSVNDRVIGNAIKLFTRPMANPDGTMSNIFEDIEQWQKQTRGAGGKPENPNSIRYSLLAVFTAFYFLMRNNRDISEASAWKVLLFEMNNEQRERLGMTGDLSHTRYALIEKGFDENATDLEKEVSRKESEREYARFTKFFSGGTNTFNPSPFSLNAKMRNEKRLEIRKNLKHPERRITPETEILHQQRLMDICNKIVASSVIDAPAEGYSGDIATDETILLTLTARQGHGVRPELKHAIDPDTSYWPGKGGDDTEKGFGYGITYIVRVPRPYGKQIPNVVVGMHIGDITGGAVAPVRDALEHAERHNLTLDKPDRYFIADRGYSVKDAWAPMCIEKKYKMSCDYPTSWSQDVEIPDTTQSGAPAPGPRIIAGKIRCPGAIGLHESRLTNINTPVMGLSAKKVIKHARKVRYLDSLAMPIRNGFKKMKSATKGRPSKEAPPEKWSITVQCPAVLGMVNCVNAPQVNGLRTPGIPDVPNPPHPNNPELRPRACLQDSVTYQLGVKDIKRIQSDTWGSFIQQDIYETVRAANERNHSQAKDANSGGIIQREWVEVRGIAKVGLLVAIATAVTSQNLIQSVRTENGVTPLGSREVERNRRRRIFEKLEEYGDEHFAEAS